jgi:hypothetical protein
MCVTGGAQRSQDRSFYPNPEHPSHFIQETEQMPIPNRSHGVSLHNIRELLIPSIRPLVVAEFGEASTGVSVDLLTMFPDDHLVITFKSGDWVAQRRLFVRHEIDDSLHKTEFEARAGDFLKRCHALIS